MEAQSTEYASRVAAIAVLAVAAILVLVGVISFFDLERLFEIDEAKLKLELLKISYQFLLLVVLGGAVSWLLKRYETARASKERELRDERNRQETARADEERRQAEVRRLFLDTHSALVAAYNSAKRVRRLLRARAITESPGGDSLVRREPYDTLLEALVDAQLTFESQIHRIEANKDVFAGLSEDDIESLKSIESYLGKIIKEHGSLLRHFGAEDTQSLAALERLKEFIRPYKRALSSTLTSARPSNLPFASSLSWYDRAQSERPHCVANRTTTSP